MYYRREKRDVPFIITACVREVERRGVGEVGLYRVSGSASDLTKLRKSFESNSYEAEQLLKEVLIGEPFVISTKEKNHINIIILCLCIYRWMSIQ